MRKLIYILPAIIIYSCSENKPTTPDGKPDGAALYQEHCSICHGDDGKLGASGSKDLSLSTLSLEERLTIITNGKGAMSPFKDVMDDEQRKAVAEYLENLRK